jgi:hypothetical protein
VVSLILEVVSIILFVVSIIMFCPESAGAMVVVSELVVDSPLLLQAINAPAIQTTAKSFFIVLWF